MSTPGGSAQTTEIYNPLLEFKAGVTACLVSWSALRTAVESGWGGGERESQKKAEDLRCNIFLKMDGRKCPLPDYDTFDFADDLAIFIEEEFSVTLEDGSERQLAEAIFQIYERCMNGDPTLARQMVAQATRVVALSGQYPVKVQSTEHDDEDDEMELSETSAVDKPTNQVVGVGTNVQQSNANDGMPSNLVDYVSQPLFGKEKRKKDVAVEPIRQLGQAVPGSDDVEMDDDGFAPVKKKGSRRR